MSLAKEALIGGASRPKVTPERMTHGKKDVHRTYEEYYKRKSKERPTSALKSIGGGAAIGAGLGALTQVGRRRKSVAPALLLGGGGALIGHLARESDIEEIHRSKRRRKMSKKERKRAIARDAVRALERHREADEFHREMDRAHRHHQLIRAIRRR